VWAGTATVIPWINNNPNIVRNEDRVILGSLNDRIMSALGWFGCWIRLTVKRITRTRLLIYTTYL
ncbi:uncharacterized protein METZ01_LOCUS187088, partial [marine metagenome]